MIVQAAIVLIALFCVGYYVLYHSPIKRMNQFAKKAQSYGYKVKILPYQFMKYYMIKYDLQDQKSLRFHKEELKNYDVIVGNMFTNLAVMIIKPNLVQSFYSQLNKLPKNPFISQVLQFFIGQGIAFTEGQIWRRNKKIISSVFTFQFLNQMIPEIQNQIEQKFNQMDSKIRLNEIIDIRYYLASVLSSIIAKCFFGSNLSQHQIQGKPFFQFFIQFLQQMNAFMVSPEHILLRMLGSKYQLTKQSRNLVRKKKILRSLATQITLKQIQKCQNKKMDKQNLITSMFQNNLINENSITLIVSLFFEFVGAGTDTNMHAINLVFHYLSQNPKYKQNILGQLNKINSNSSLSPMQRVKQMVHIQSVYNQSLRLNGPVSQIVTRIAAQDLRVGELDIPKGSTINVLPLLNHYKEQNFKDAKQFLPERWINQDKVNPFTFTPFGGGQRGCIGQSLARIQVKLIVSKLIQKYQFESVKKIKMSKQLFYHTIYSQFLMKIRKFQEKQIM